MESRSSDAVQRSCLTLSIKASISFTSSTENQCSSPRAFLDKARKWIAQTPERALNRAYHAALAIKLIAKDHEEGNRLISPTRWNVNAPSYLNASFHQFFNSIHLGLIEFRLSHFVLRNQNLEYAEAISLVSENVEKLKLIDYVLEAYQSRLSPPSRLFQFLHKPVDSSKGQRRSRLRTIDIEATEIYNREG